MHNEIAYINRSLDLISVPDILVLFIDYVLYIDLDVG